MNIHRPANSNPRAAELYEFDAVGFRAAIASYLATIKPIQPKPVKIEDTQFDHRVDDLEIPGR